MICERPLVPGLPGEDSVTDGSVDFYEMDWDMEENNVPEDCMARRRCRQPCGPAPSDCLDNQPEQTDEEAYEMIRE